MIEMPDSFYKLPPARVLVADPPWAFDDKLPGDGRGAEKHYATLTISDIMRFPLPPLGEPCLLALWRVAAMQQEALDVLKAWGFTLKTEIVWRKKSKNGNDAFGMGHYVRGAHEVALLATRGGRFHVKDKAVRSIFETFSFDAEIGEHSAKPDAFYDLIERLSGEGPYVELFARRGRPGWHCFGNELPGGYAFSPAVAKPEAAPEVNTATPGPTAPKTEPEPAKPAYVPCSEATVLKRLYEGLALKPETRTLLIARGVNDRIITADVVAMSEEDAFRGLAQGAPQGWFDVDTIDVSHTSPLQTTGDLAEALKRRGIAAEVQKLGTFVGPDLAAAEFYALFGGPIPECIAKWAPAAQKGGKGSRGGRKKADTAAAPTNAPTGTPGARDEDAVRAELEAPPPGMPPHERPRSSETWIVARVRAADHEKAVESLSDADELARHGAQDFAS